MELQLYACIKRACTGKQPHVVHSLGQTVDFHEAVEHVCGNNGKKKPNSLQKTLCLHRNECKPSPEWIEYMALTFKSF